MIKISTKNEGKSKKYFRVVMSPYLCMRIMYTYIQPCVIRIIFNIDYFFTYFCSFYIVGNDWGYIEIIIKIINKYNT